MTCIVAIRDEKTKKTYMAGDSAGFDPWGRKLYRKDKKIFKIKTIMGQEIMMGFTTSYRMGQILQYSFKPSNYPVLAKPGEIMDYMVNHFINGIRDCFKHNGFGEHTDSKTNEGGIFLVAIKDRLFMIESDFQVAEVESEYASCGCGEDFANAALLTMEKLNSKLQPKEKLELALEVAKFYHSWIDGENTHLELKW